MKNVLLLFLLVLCCIPPINLNAAVMTTLEVEFAFSGAANQDQQLLGYRLYQEGKQICETNNPSVSKITCDLLAEAGTFDFTLTAHYINGSESPHSPSFPFSINSIPVPPAESTGDKTISYSWDNNVSDATLAGYRMYMNNALLCETNDPKARSMSCNTDLLDAPMEFTVASFYINGSESLRSNILLLDSANMVPGSDPLLAVINPTPATGQVPLNVSFSGTASTGDIASYSWNYGDGASGTGSVASHTYTNAGTYTATLTVKDQNGASHKATTTITAQPNTSSPQPPTAVLSSSTAAGNAPLLVSFDGDRKSVV